MTAPRTSPGTSTAPVAAAPSDRTRPLLQLDGALCAAMGGALALATGPAADLLGTDATGVVRAVGIALAVYGVALVAGAGTGRARGLLLAAGAGNLGWEVASLAGAALAELSTVGRLVVAAQGLVVGALGLVQLRAARR